MAHTEDLPRAQVLIIPNATLQRAVSEQPAATPPYQVEPNLASNPLVEQEDSREWHGLAKVAAGVALTSSLLLGGEQQAGAAPVDAETVVAQPPSQEPNASGWLLYGSLGLTAASLLTTVVLSTRSMARQAKEKREDRFITALQGIKGESSGEERALRVADLYHFADSEEYAPKVFREVLMYLRGRRGGLELLRKDHKVGSADFELAVTERRNADREALNLLLTTLPAARKQLRGSGVKSGLKRLIGADEQYRLGKQTGTLRSKDKPRVNARGLNLDFIRGVKECSFRDTDLTGAGMQGNQFTNVIFRNARLCEAQFEGSTLYRCSLRKTDARAAYWYGASIEECVVDKHTKLGNLPDNHPDAKFGSLNPDTPNAYRGDPEVILKDLIPKGMSKEQLVEQIHEWQRNGLRLGAGSNPEYFLNPDT